MYQNKIKLFPLKQEYYMNIIPFARKTLALSIDLSATYIGLWLTGAVY
jgi:hypothetical protein